VSFRKQTIHGELNHHNSWWRSMWTYLEREPRVCRNNIVK